jgi:hypothetical protein
VPSALAPSSEPVAQRDARSSLPAGKAGAKLLLPYHHELNILRSSRVVIKEQISLPVAREGSFKSPLSHVTFSLVPVPSNLAAELQLQTAPKCGQVHAGPGEGSALKEEPHNSDVETCGTDKSYVTLSSA